VSQDDLRVLVERRNAALDQVARVQVVVGGPLEQLAPGLLDQDVMIRRASDVARLPDVPDPRVLLRVATADIRGPVRRGVVRNDQLEVLIGLPEQSVERFGQVLLAVIDRKPDAQPGNRGHISSPVRRVR